MNVFLAIWMDIAIVMEDILNIVEKTTDGHILAMTIVGYNNGLFP